MDSTVTAATMPSLPVVLASAAALLVAALYLRSKMKHDGGRLNLPPGYIGWPLLGEALAFAQPCLSTTLGSFMERRTSKFGKIFTMNLLGKKLIVSADSDMNRFVMNNEPRLFESFLPEHMLPLAGTSDFVKGDANKEFRAILTNFFSTSRLQSSMIHDANQIASSLFGRLETDKVFKILDIAEQYTLDIFAKNVLSMEPGARKTRELGEDCEKIVEGLFSFPINLPGTTWNVALKGKKVVMDVMRRYLGEGKRQPEEVRAERNDLLGNILRRNSLSDNAICELIQGVLVAGKSSSVAIGLLLYFLEDCPKALEELREEHIKIGGSRKPDGSRELTWDAYKKMDFTQCVINEALRLGNIARIAARKAIVPNQFQGYEIPAGCQVITHISAVHLDPSIFPDPLSFNPWRWQSNSGVKRSNSFMAFGGGIRLCPGAELARMEMAVFMHHFLLDYDWKSEVRDRPIASPRVKFHKGLPIKVYKRASMIVRLVSKLGNWDSQRVGCGWC